MQIKRKDLEILVSALEASTPVRSVYKDDHRLAVALGQLLLEFSPDPVDVVPVQDYPFPMLTLLKAHPKCPKAFT